MVLQNNVGFASLLGCFFGFDIGFYDFDLDIDSIGTRVTSAIDPLARRMIVLIYASARMGIAKARPVNVVDIDIWALDVVVELRSGPNLLWSLWRTLQRAYQICPTGFGRPHWQARGD